MNWNFWFALIFLFFTYIFFVLVILRRNFVRSISPFQRRVKLYQEFFIILRYRSYVNKSNFDCVLILIWQILFDLSICLSILHIKIELGINTNFEIPSINPCWNQTRCTLICYLKLCFIIKIVLVPQAIRSILKPNIM